MYHPVPRGFCQWTKTGTDKWSLWKLCLYFLSHINLFGEVFKTWNLGELVTVGFIPFTDRLCWNYERIWNSTWCCLIEDDWAEWCGTLSSLFKTQWCWNHSINDKGRRRRAVSCFLSSISCRFPNSANCYSAINMFERANFILNWDTSMYYSKYIGM